MSSSLPIPVRLSPPLALLGITALFAAASSSDACSPATRYAWQRTFYAYNALDYPLAPYNTPRTPGFIRCDYASGQAYGGTGCSGRQAFGGWNYLPQDAIGLESVELERLGQVPNDMAAMGLEPAGSTPRSNR